MFDDAAFRLGTELLVLRARMGNLKRRVVCLLDGWTGYPRLRRLYRERIGVPLDLDRPRRYTEKIQWRKFSDRRPVFRRMADKSAARRWIAERLGAERAADWTVPVLFEVATAQAIPFGTITGGCVIKGSHGSGYNTFVRPGTSRLGRREIVRRARVHLAREYGLEYHEWAYWGGRRVLVGEPLLANADGTAPIDIKFHMFGETCVMMHCNVYGPATTDGTPPIGSQHYYTADWQRMDERILRSAAGDLPRPSRLDEMHEIARLLADGFDYLRVDFMLVDDRPYLGEVTLYPNSGFKRFEPDAADLWLGEHWTLPGTDRVAAVGPTNRAAA